MATVVPEVLSVNQAAVVLGIGKNLCYRLIREKRLAAVRLGAKRLVIPRRAVDALLNGQLPEQPAERE